MDQMKGCHLLIGEDSWSKNQFIEELKKQIFGDQLDMMNVLEVKDKEVAIEQVFDFAETLPFFTDYKFVYLKDTGLFKTGKKDEAEKFAAFIKNIPDYLILIIDETEVDKRGKLYKTIKAEHTIKEFIFPGEEAIYKMLAKKSEEKGIQMDVATLYYFIRNMPEDIAYILNEWEKLTGYVEEKKITKAHIDAICVFSLEQRVFELTKKIGNKNANEALEIYGRMVQSKESPIGILVLIGRQYRMLLQVKYLVRIKKTPKEIASELKLPFFAAKEMVETVRGYQFKDLEQVIQACLKTDRDIKTGQMEMTKRVELLIMECLSL